MDERARALLEAVQRGLAELERRVPEGTPPSPSHVSTQGVVSSRGPHPAGTLWVGQGEGPSELAFLSAAELGRRLGRRELSPVEVVEDALGRIERLDGRLGCYVMVLADRALAAARAAEAELTAGVRRGPLHGVPLALKDIFDTAGLETASGSKALRGYVPTEDAHVVARLRAAGTILLGKLNMHELAYGLTTTNPHYGPTRNPWDRERVPGGSSGGSAAALAAGLCHLSLGTDTGGSIRLPAGACGIVGLKPTFGRVSRRGVLPLSWSLDHVGPMTRTVEDAALVMDAIAGPDAGDPWCADRRLDGYAAGLDAPIAGLRLGVPSDHFFEGVEPSVERSVRGAIDVLARLGAAPVEVPLPHARDGYFPLLAILGAEASAFHAPRLRERPADIGEDVRLRLEFGALLRATDVVVARRWQWLVREDFRRAFERCDVLAGPTIPHVAPKIGQAIRREPGTAWNGFMVPFNLAGLPSISVPCGLADGLPVGLQIAGRPFDEPTVLQVARAYERETEWQRQRPDPVR